MSTQTEHLGLHQWEPSDPFLRTDFNEDFAKIDAGVGEALAAAQAAAAAPYVVGKVNLTAISGNNGTATVNLGFTPSAVIVGGKFGLHSDSTSNSNDNYNSQGFAIGGEGSCTVGLQNAEGQFLNSNNNFVTGGVYIINGGFQIFGLNIRANPYRYIAFR